MPLGSGSRFVLHFFLSYTQCFPPYLLHARNEAPVQPPQQDGQEQKPFGRLVTHTHTYTHNYTQQICARSVVVGPCQMASHFRSHQPTKSVPFSTTTVTTRHTTPAPSLSLSLSLSHPLSHCVSVSLSNREKSQSYQRNDRDDCSFRELTGQTVPQPQPPQQTHKRTTKHIHEQKHRQEIG